MVQPLKFNDYYARNVTDCSLFEQNIIKAAASLGLKNLHWAHFFKRAAEQQTTARRRHIAALLYLHLHLLAGGNVRDMTSCSSTGNPTPMGNASQHSAGRAWTQIRLMAGLIRLWSGAIKVGNYWVTEEDKTRRQNFFSAERLRKKQQRKQGTREWMSDCYNPSRRNISPTHKVCLLVCVRKSEGQRAKERESQERSNQTDKEMAGTGTGLARSHSANHQPDSLSE